MPKKRGGQKSQGRREKTGARKRLASGVAKAGAVREPKSAGESHSPVVPVHAPVSKTFPVAGVGASAGGLEAFQRLLRSLPEDTGMAFVFVQHLDPEHTSMLTELLSRSTAIPVREVVEGMRVEPNHIYVIPPNTNMTIGEGILHLGPRQATRGKHMPIDWFLRSLAEDQRSRAVAVILSGTGSDGALGLEATKAEGGITFAQDPLSAKYDNMPRSAVATGAVDFVLGPEEIARELSRIARHPYVAEPPKSEDIEQEGADQLNKILSLLRSATGVDFAFYRRTTTRRRIVRRMALHKIDTLENYVRFLRNNPGELEALCQEILIKVTGFFRDPEVFDSLRREVFPQITKDRSADSPIRVWVPGCSTGEEAYSIAISLLEHLGGRASAVPIQIFATDVSEASIDKARSGTYIENIAADVSPDRLRRFFTKVDSMYQITKPIRDMCIFAVQNLLSDPPFSRLDLISCRNVLIYMEPVLQKRVIPAFHYALKPTGFLVLGSSEALGPFAESFLMVDKKHKIFAKKTPPAMLRPELGGLRMGDGSEHAKTIGRTPEEVAIAALDFQREADRIILGRYAPPGVIVNDDLEIVQFRGRTSPYLEPAPGKATLNLLPMAREGLLPDLRGAIQKCRKAGESVKKKGVRIVSNGQVRNVNFEVIPLRLSAGGRHYLVLFEDAQEPARVEAEQKAGRGAQKREEAESRQAKQLKQELAAAKEYLQSMIAELEATNEELQSANEEILSSNEELQSINEELETAKEELQSTNEELTTVNEELQNRNLELTHVNDDLNNLLSSVTLPIVMLESDLRIRRFTPTAAKVLNLIAADIGRPITDLKLGIEVSDLEQMVIQVIEEVSIRQKDVQDREGRWYLLQVRPYRTAQNKIDGAVLTLIDVHALKMAEERMRSSENLYRALFERTFETLDEGVLLLNAKTGVITHANSLLADMLGYQRSELLDRRPWEMEAFAPSAGAFLELHRAGNVHFDNLKLQARDGRLIDVELTGWLYVAGEERLIQGNLRDVTERKRLEDRVPSSAADRPRE